MTSIQRERGYWWSEENSVIWEGFPEAPKGPVMLSTGVVFKGVCLVFKRCISHTLPHRTTLGVIGACMQKRSAYAKAGHTRPSCTTQSSSHSIINGICCPVFHCSIGVAVNKLIEDNTPNWTASILISFMMHSQALREWVHNPKGSKCPYHHSLEKRLYYQNIPEAWGAGLQMAVWVPTRGSILEA